MKSNPAYIKIIAWGLLFVYLSGAFKPLYPFLEYRLNYDYISKVLCENKENAEMNCNGKCHLTKELKRVAEDESQKKQVSVKLIESETIPAQELMISFLPSMLIQNNIYPSIQPSIIAANEECTTPPPRS